MKLSQVNQLNYTIDKRLNNLGIFKLSLENALIYLLRNFEDRCRLSLIPTTQTRSTNQHKILQSTHQMAREGMDALSVLLIKVYQRCKPTNQIDRNCKEDMYEQAGKALEIAYSYSQIKDAIHLSKIGVYKMFDRDGKIYFVPSKGSINYDAQAQIISFWSVEKEAISMEYPKPSAGLFDLFSQYINNAGLSRLITIDKSNSFLYHIPADISAELTRMIQYILQKKWTLTDSIQLGEYSIGEAKAIWASLLKLSIFHNIACLISGLPGVGLEYLPAVIKKQNLINWLYLDSNVNKHKISEIITDLTFNNRVSTNEIMFQPLLPLGGDILLIAPNIFIFSNPERNLMKLWAIAYSGVYGAKIAAKGKEEEIILASKLKKVNKNFLVLNSKKIKKNGRIITDIDLAVYDKSNPEVLLIQLKWFLKPDSSREVRSSDDKLNNGIDQLHKISDYIEYELDALERVFNCRLPKLKSIYMCVISSSNTGSFWVKKDFDVFNQEIVINSLKYLNKASIRNIYKKWTSLHSFRAQVNFRSVFHVLRYDGRRYLIPATEIIDGNIFKIFFGYLMYFVFEVVLMGHHHYWPQRESLNIFAKSE